MTEILSIEKLSKTYSLSLPWSRWVRRYLWKDQSVPQIRTAVENVSFSVQEGEIVALIGESGSGKSTILRLIAGLEKPQKGQIQIEKKTVSTPEHCTAPETRQIGMVFQNYALFPHLTIRQNITYGLHQQNKKQQQARVTEILDLLQLKDYAHQSPHQISGGQQQRVALGRALASKPQLLLLDEPFSNLDVMLKAPMRQEIRKIIQETKTTAIIVTHDEKDAFALADRIIILRQGEVQQIGTPEEVYHQPQNAYVANFFGKTNLLNETEKNKGAKLEDGRKAIRPENLTLAKNGVRGVVKDVTFYGQYYEVVVEPKEGEEELVVYTPNLEGVEVGATVSVTHQD